MDNMLEVFVLFKWLEKGYKSVLEGRRKMHNFVLRGRVIFVKVYVKLLTLNKYGIVFHDKWNIINGMQERLRMIIWKYFKDNSITAAKNLFSFLSLSIQDPS